jgi:hypothetical protein
VQYLAAATTPRHQLPLLNALRRIQYGQPRDFHARHAGASQRRNAPSPWVLERLRPSGQPSPPRGSSTQHLTPRVAGWLLVDNCD